MTSITTICTFSLIDLTALFHKIHTLTDLRPEWKNFGICSFTNHIVAVQTTKGKTGSQNVSIPYIGQPKLHTTGTFAAFYHQYMKIAKHLEYQYPFFLPVVIKSRWNICHETKLTNVSHIRQTFFLYPTFAIYEVTFRILVDVPMTNELIKPMDHLFKEYRANAKQFLLKSLLQPQMHEQIPKIMLRDSPPMTVIFDTIKRKKNYEWLGRSSLYGNCRSVNNLTNWYFFDRINTCLFLGNQLSSKFNQKIRLCLYIWCSQREQRKYLSQNYKQLLEDLSRLYISGMDKNAKNSNTQFSAEVNNLIGMFMISMNTKFYYERHIVPCLPKAYQRYLFRKLSEYSHTDKDFPPQFQQMLINLSLFDQRFLIAILDLCEKAGFEEERQIVQQFLKNSSPAVEADGVELTDDQKKILTILADQYIKNEYESQKLLLSAPNQLWSCINPYQLMQQGGFTKRIYEENSEFYQNTLGVLLRLKLITINEDPKREHGTIYCLNGEMKYIQGLIEERRRIYYLKE